MKIFAILLAIPGLLQVMVLGFLVLMVLIIALLTWRSRRKRK